MKRIFILMLSIFTVDSYAQKTFIKHYGESSGEGNSLIINSDGNYIIAGKKGYKSNFDQFCTYEINSHGDSLWLKHYGTDSAEQTNQIIQTIDGGYASIGYSSDYWSSYQTIYLVKTTNSGIVSWTKKIGVGQESATSIVQTVSGEYFIAGKSKHNSQGLFDYYLLKTDVDGDTLWTKKYGGSKNEELNSLRQTSDGGFILSGYSESFSYGSKDCYLVKINSNGDTLWTKHYGGTLGEVLKSVRQTSDGGYVMTGYSQSCGVAAASMYVVKTNSIGDTSWTKTYGQMNRLSWGSDIIQTSDGGYIITGQIKTASSNGGFDLYLVKIDASGNVEWEKEFKIEPSNTSHTSSEGRSIVQTSDGGFAISGYWFSGSTYELLLIKTHDDGTVGLEELQTNSTLMVFPNPTAENTILKISSYENINTTVSIYDLLGQNVFTENVNLVSGQNQIPLSTTELSNGIYLVKINSNSVQSSTSLVIQK